MQNFQKKKRLLRNQIYNFLAFQVPTLSMNNNNNNNYYDLMFLRSFEVHFLKSNIDNTTISCSGSGVTQ